MSPLALLVPALVFSAGGPPAHGAPTPAAPAPPAAFEGQLSGDGSHACLLRPTHDVICWGLDLQNVHIPTPSGESALVPGLTDAQEIAAGVAHACAIRAGGQVVCWGYNGLGQLGVPADKAFHVQPQNVVGVTDAQHLASAANRTCAVRANGMVSCWGSWDPYVAQDADVSTVPGLANVKSLVMSDVHACALQTNGRVACWGDDVRGECGNGRKDAKPFSVASPEAVVGLDDAVQLAAARLDTCALRKNGQVVCWGDRAGQYAPANKKGGTPYALTPVPVPGAMNAKAIFLTDKAGCLLRAQKPVALGATPRPGAADDENQLACWWPLFEPWAQPDFAKLHPSGTKLIDVKLPALAKSTRQLLWAEEDYALVAGGKLLRWGGRGARLASLPVKGIADAVDVSSGASQSCAVRAGGQVLCWGAIGAGTESSGADGQLAAKFSAAPVAVPKLVNAASVSVGAAHACAVDKAGALWCWGNNAAGQLGIGKKGAGLSSAVRAKAKSMSPVPPPELLPREAVAKVKLPTKVVQVAAGIDSTCALTDAGAVFCWGDGKHGQLGTGALSSLSPVQIPGLGDVARIAVGDAAACAVKKDGALLCWGRDQLGLTGDGKEGFDLRAPTPVPGVTAAVDVTLAEGATCAVLKGGGAQCWGHRSRYLGDDDPGVHGAASATVKGVADAAAITASVDQRCVRHAGGTVSCWGRNMWGVLGDGTRIDRLSPVEVVGLGPVKALSAGLQQTCAVRASGEVVCWGAHALGGLGDGQDPTAPHELPLTVAAAAPPAPAPAAPAAPTPTAPATK